MQRQTILVVDDDRDIRAFTKLLLERAGYKVLTATDGEEGLRVYQTHRATLALLLTDVRMPKMNGVDLADRVLQLDSEFPILLMTGDGLAAPWRYEYVAKPVAPAELVRRVGEALDASERL
jgi:CheY-like chemotaxis protein